MVTINNLCNYDNYINLTEYQNLSNKLQHQYDYSMILWIIIILIMIIFLVFMGRYYYRQWFMYKIGIVKNNRVKWFYKSNLDETTIKLSFGKEIKHYTIVPDCIYGLTILYYYDNPNPIKLDALNEDNIAVIKDQELGKLRESTVIEKFVTANDFLGLFKILLIITLIAVCLVGIYIYYSNSQPIECFGLINDTLTYMKCG